MSDSTYRGQITRIDGQGIYVLVPKLGRNVEYGPCLRLRDNQPVSDGSATMTLYQPGAQVLVQTINGIPDDLVVLGVLG